MQIEKNIKFRRGCTGTLYYHPYEIWDNMTLSGVYTAETGYWTTVITKPDGVTGISVGDLIVMGQNTFHVMSHSGNSITAAVPDGAYLYDGTSVIGDMNKLVDRGYVFRPRYGTGGTYSGCAWWYDNGSYLPILCGHAGSPNLVIDDVYIREYNILRDQATYGWNSHVYNTNNEYEVMLYLPYKTPLESVNQLLESRCVAFQMDDRATETMTNSYGYTFDRPIGGGSISPVVRKISLKTETLKQEVRRGRYQITGILEG